MNDKVFISYAKEDYGFAEKLYIFLAENNFNPWLDKKGILPGQNWDYVIKKSLREANYIILLLSNISVQKRGYVQREFKLALEYFEEKLEDDIYLIPLKINDCEIPQRLSRFQWVEYSSGECFDLVLQSLHLQRQKYAELEKKLIASKELFEYKEYELNFEYGDKNSYRINTSYFQFLDETNPSLLEINAIIKGKNIEQIVASRKDFHEISGELINNEYSTLGWEYDISYTPNLISKSIISINENFYSFTGGAHGNGFINGINYHLNPTYKINLEDLFEFEEHEKVLNFLSDFCYAELRKLYNESFEISEKEIEKQEKGTLFWEDCLSPKWENFNTFLISKQGLEIIFNAYSVSAYAFGLHFIQIPFDKIISILTNGDKLKYLNDKLK
jgi:hypothetical protein